MNQEEHKQLGAALGKIPSGLFVATARKGEQETGMLASWVQQCSFEPAQITMAVRHGRELGSWLTEGAYFTVNILDENQTDMIAHFGRGFSAGEPAFHGLEIRRLAEGGPILSEALGFLVCRVTARFPAGDHDVILAQVCEGKILSEGQPMVHIRKSGFHY